MIRQHEKSHDNVIGFSVADEVTDSERERVFSELRDAISRHGKIRVLYRVTDVSPVELFRAPDERLSFLKEHGDDVERIAVVTDDGIGPVSELVGKVTPVQVRQFDKDEEARAWAWLE
jgi:hypothetical protein